MSKKNSIRKKSIKYRRGIDFRGGDRINRKIYKESVRRGRVSEERIREVLKEIKEEGEIRDFSFFPAFSYKDKAGIDCEIYLKDGERIPPLK